MCIMCKICVLAWCLLSTVIVPGQQTKPLTLTGRVVDSKARPVAGAEVAVYERFYDYSVGKGYAKLLNRIKKTDANGHFVLNANICSWYKVFVVARKEGLALGWDVLTQGARYRSDSNFIVLEEPCVLAGFVVDEAGNPVAGAKVRAAPKTCYLRRLEQEPILAPREWFTTQTDDKGNFCFDNFAADVSADFRIEAPGWTSAYEYTTHWASSCGFEAGRTDIRLILPEEVVVQGQVIGAENGRPLENAIVIIQPDSIKGNAENYFPNRTVSGQNGRFKFEGVPPGKHKINVSVPKGTIELVDKRIKFNVQANQEVKEVTVALDKGGLIEIIAREEGTKESVSDLPIYFWQAIQDEQSNFYKDVITGNDGRLRIWAPPGECKLSARYDRYLPQDYEDQVIVTKGKTTKLEILLDSYPSVSGLVLDETGRPVSGALVKANPDGEQALTDQAGRFEVGFDPRWPCERLIVRHMERNLAAIVDVKGSSKPIQVTLKPALSIAGQVSDPNGVGIPAARFALSLSVPGWLTQFGPEIITDSQGRYKMKAVPLVQEGFIYRISVNSSGYGIKQYERISITGEPGTEVKMKPLILQPADLLISGVVVDTEGKPAAGVPIFLHPAKGQASRTTTTDDNGRFSIKRVCKGPLRLQANFSNNPDESGSVKTQSFEKNIKIILGQIKVYQHYISLMSKPLPEMEDLKIAPLPADADNRMILVCFWDMQQRPSRHCLRQLSTKAQELKTKDISIVAVQVSMVDEEALEEWMSQNSIAFSVGMIQGDIEKSRIAWGVRSLPWLILTDKEHIVRAEGFALEELSERIKEAGGGER